MLTGEYHSPAIFTVGSDKVTVNGTRTDLGYTFDLYDGLPTIRIKKLCEIFDYDYTIDENQMVIYACTDEERAQIERSRQYSWEFNDELTIGNWTSRMCNVSFANDGYMTITSTGNDAGISHTVDFMAEDYAKILIGLRYTPSMDGKVGTVYFTSDTGTYNIDVRYDTLTANKPYGSLIIWEINTSAETSFNGNIKLLRFDPSTENGAVFKVDFIRCVKNNEGDVEFDTSVLF